jgi:hypothetical protein
MAIIKVPNRITDNFGDGLNKFFSILEKVQTVEKDEEITFDLTTCSFLTPFFLLPFFLLIQIESAKREVKFILPEDLNFASYLQFIHFNSGLKPEDFIMGDYEKLMNEYSKKKYIPLIDFPADRLMNNSDIRDNFLSAINTLLTKQVQLTVQFKSAIMYLIDEAVNNVVDHSGENRGFIFAQFFPANGYLDVCIGDCGKTILGSYQTTGKHTITNDKDALISASKGLSTKNRPEAESRGFGISTSLKMLTNGLNGKYSLLSGAAILVKTLERSEVVTIPRNLYWRGTIVSLRIPISNNSSFNIADYYE